MSPCGPAKNENQFPQPHRDLRGDLPCTWALIGQVSRDRKYCTDTNTVNLWTVARRNLEIDSVKRWESWEEQSKAAIALLCT